MKWTRLNWYDHEGHVYVAKDKVTHVAQFDDLIIVHLVGQSPLRVKGDIILVVAALFGD